METTKAGNHFKLQAVAVSVGLLFLFVPTARYFFLYHMPATSYIDSADRCPKAGHGNKVTSFAVTVAIASTFSPDIPEMPSFISLTKSLSAPPQPLYLFPARASPVQT